MPVRVAVWGEPGASSVSVSVPFLIPTLVGANSVVTVQVCPGHTVAALHVFAEIRNGNGGGLAGNISLAM